jgi:hypothetical protein
VPLCRIAARGEQGTILIVTMWILMALTGLVLVLGRAMRVEGGCSANDVAELQADAIEQGAIQYVLAHVDSLQGQVPTDTDMPCEAVRVGEGAFWIVRPNFDNDRAYGYGVVDEASKVNLNASSSDTVMLSKLPGMTVELAASIVDWRDADEVPTQGGAESSYYLLLNDPYQCKNSPLETVEELLLVKGVTRDILYGEDFNHNGVLDVNEDDGEASEPPDNRDGLLDRGPAPFVTVYSTEQNATPSGNTQIDIDNNAQTEALIDLMNRQHKDNRPTRVTIQQIRSLRPYRNIINFYDRYCRPNGWSVADFEAIADKITAARPGSALRGLTNANTAPREVLTCLPGLDDSDVSVLLAKRSDGGANLDSIAWVLQALQPQKAVAIGDLITARSYQFSADIVSVAGNGRAFRRCRVVVDARNSPPKVIYRQNLTHLGWPLEEELLTRLRAGVNLDDAVAEAKNTNTSHR